MSLLLVAPAFAGAWVREAGDVYAKAGVGSFIGGEAPEEPMAEAVAYRDIQASLYAEVGLPLRFQLAGYAPWVLAENQREDIHYVGLSGGDAELLLSRAILEGPVVLSGAIGAKLPLYEDRTQARVDAFGAHGSRFPAPGDGQVDLDARLDVGAGLGWQGAWVQASAGYRHRLEDPVDGVIWSAQLGLAPKQAGWVGVEASGVVTVEDDAETREWTRLGAFGAVKLGPTLAVEAYFGAIPWAEATRTGMGGGVGVSWNRP